MAPNINNPGGDKNEPDEIRDGVVSDATRFPGGFIDQQITQAGAAVQIVGQFNVGNTTFINQFNISPQDSSVRGLAFRPDGTQLFVVGRGSDNVYQYSLSTAFDVTTAAFTSSFSIGSEDGNAQGLTFRPDGSVMYMIGAGTDKIYQYSLSTDYDVTTASLDSSFDVSTQDGTPTEVTIKPDGSRIYITGGGGVNVYQYDLSTAYDITTASFTQSFDVSSQDGNPTGLSFKPDGSQMFVTGVTNSSVYQYSLTSDYDISTASFVRAFGVATQTTQPNGLSFKPDGSHLYVLGDGVQNLYQYAVGSVGGELG
jgi:sugar lactone lactonase YvrE